MKTLIETTVKQTVAASGLNYFREPLFGYAAADEPIFTEFQKIVSPQHRLPTDILPEARSALAFYLPFQHDIARRNRFGKTASREWAQVYIKTNQLISKICDHLQQVLAEAGVRFDYQPPTYFFDTELLVAAWSHKHIAYACGLGTFGRNSLLITAKGCAGRLGSGVLDLTLPPSPRPENIRFCPADTGGCSEYCQKICPVGAFDGGSFNRKSCYEWCQENDKYYHDLDSCEVCGKCATGPCGYIE